jgi:hypothetical protein
MTPNPIDRHQYRSNTGGTMGDNDDSTTAINGMTKSDEQMRKVLKPNPTQDQVLEVIRKSYVDNKDADSVKIIRQLDSYDDSNYLVEIAGTRYLLKFHNGVESKDFLETYTAAGQEYYKAGHMTSVIHLQTAMMQLLNREGIRTSVPIPPKQKDLDVNNNNQNKGLMPLSVHSLAVVSDEHSPCDLVVRLLSWYVFSHGIYPSRRVKGSSVHSLLILDSRSCLFTGYQERPCRI